MSLVQLFCSLWLSAQQLYGEVNGNLQEGFCHGLCDQVAAPRAPAPAAGYCWLAPPQKTQTQVWLRLCKVSGSWCAQGFVWALRASLAGMGFDTKRDFSPPTSYWGFSFALGRGVSFLVGYNILLSMVIQKQVVIVEFSQEKMSSCSSSPPSCQYNGSQDLHNFSPSRGEHSLRWPPRDSCLCCYQRLL